MRVLIYEEYDAALHGNQRYICLLLRFLPGPMDQVDLVVPHEGPLFEHASKLSSVATLEAATWRRRVSMLGRVIGRRKPDVVLCNNERSLLTVARPLPGSRLEHPGRRIGITKGLTLDLDDGAA